MYLTKESRWGPCKFLAKDEYVGRSIYNYGEYNPDETEMILSLANGVCLDIGANIGCITMALLAKGFDVKAFEPQPIIADLLWKNMNSRGQMFEMACGSSNCIVKMPKVHYSERGNFGGLGIGTLSPYGWIDVKQVTIDSLNFTGVGFIKLDVEGYELEALLGAQETIKRDKPILYVEDDRQEKSAALRAFIKALGYSIQEHKPTLYRENNWFGLKKNIWDKNYASHNLICKPC